jgi:hypothetical protein
VPRGLGAALRPGPRRRAAPFSLLQPNTYLERDELSSNRHPALHYWWSMIFSENRYPLFGIML